MIEVHIDGMTCGHRVSVATRAVKSVDPGANVQADRSAPQLAPGMCDAARNVLRRRETLPTKHRSSARRLQTRRGTDAAESLCARRICRSLTFLSPTPAPARGRWVQVESLVPQATSKEIST